MDIHITAIMKSKPEVLAETTALFKNLVQHSRKEEACLSYDLHQGKDDPNIFIFSEIWKDQAGLDEHNQQPYFKAFIERAQDNPTNSSRNLYY